MAGDDAFDKGGARAGLSQHENGGRVRVPVRGLFQPLGVKQPGHHLEQGLLPGLIVFDRLPPGGGPCREGGEGLGPLAQVFVLLAHGVVQEPLSPQVAPVAGQQPLHLANVLAVCGPAGVGQAPVGLGGIGVAAYNIVENCLSSIYFPQKYEIIRQIHHILGCAGGGGVGPGEKGFCGLIFAHLS